MRPAVGQRTEIVRLRRQLLGHRPSDVLWGWLGPLIITAIGGFFRFWQLGRPHQLVFDETYYVKQGSSFLDYGFEKSVAPSLGTTPGKLFTAGTTNVWANAPDFVVHPPVGKWMIALGELMFGQTQKSTIAGLDEWTKDVPIQPRVCAELSSDRSLPAFSTPEPSSATTGHIVDLPCSLSRITKTGIVSIKSAPRRRLSPIVKRPSRCRVIERHE